MNAKIEKLLRELRNHFDRQAKDMASLERPATDNEARLLAEEARARYRKLANEVDSSVLPGATSAAAAAEALIAEHKDNAVKEEIASKEHAHKVALLDSPRAGGTILVPLKAVGLIAISVIAIVGQSRWERQVFESSGSSASDSATIALSLVISLAFLAHVVVAFVKHLGHRIWKVITVLVVLTSVFIAYRTLGVFRAHAVASLDGEGVFDLSPERFALLSMLWFIGIAGMSAVIQPSTVQIERYCQGLRDRCALKKARREIERMKRERMRMWEEFTRSQEERAKRIETARIAKRRIHEEYRATWAHFVSINVSRRRTAHPDALFLEPPPLEI